MGAQTAVVTSKKRKAALKPGKVFVYAALIVSCAVMLLPLIFLVLTSLKPYSELLADPTGFFPKKITLESFKAVFNENPYFLYLGNTVLITTVSILGCCLTSAFVAYGFTRFKVKGNKLIFGIFISGMMIPGQILMIPMYELYDRLRWVDTFLPFLLPPLFGGGIVNIFLMRQFMKGISPSIMEAAKIDGANELRIFADITLRMVIPVCITIAIFTFIGSWNDLFGPLIYLDNPKLWTLAKGNYMIYMDEVGKQGATGAQVLPWNILSAANLLTALPIIALYFIAQRYFMQGIQISGLKE